MNDTIIQLVSKLPEKYQPIFGHPEISEEVSRTCEDRLVVIRETYDALQALLGRPLRVLDLGCAQGYFSLSLAAAGADVLGIDYLPANVAVCEALASEHSKLNAKFQIGRIEDVIESIRPDEFDLVLGLSVFHHVIHEKGILAVKNLLNTAAERVGCLLLEMALKSEPLYWGPSQPEDPRELLGNIAFTHQLALYPTHLSDISRPLVAASNRFWVLSGKAQEILSYSTEPHHLAEGTHQGSRRYYLSQEYFLKLYRLDCDRGAHNLLESHQEVSFLKNAPKDFALPSLFSYGKNNIEAWIVIERLDGQLLSELLSSGAEIDVSRVLGDVINQACQFEAAGWYHNDIRTWNTLIKKDGSAILIDYGSIVRKPQDCVWPDNIFLAFLIFLYEVATQHIESPIPLRTVAMSPGRFPAPYGTLVQRFWATPVDQWSFSLIKQLFDDAELKIEANIQPNEAWSTAIELAIQALNSNQHHLNIKGQQAETRMAQTEAKAQQAEAETRMAQSEARAQQAEAETRMAQSEARAQQAEAETRMAQSEARAQQAEAKAEQAEAALHQTLTQLHAVYASTSWKITKPLRFVKHGLNEGRTVAKNAMCSCCVLQKTLRQKVKAIVRRIGLYVLDKPVLKRKIVNYLNKHPGLKQRVRSIVMGRQAYTVPASLESQACQVAPIGVNESRLQSPLLVCIEGIGSAEKTPLEKNFNKYVGRT